jgi:hypothetical protein
MGDVAKEKIEKVDPIRTTSFGLAEHSYRSFNAIAPSATTENELTNPKLWTLIAAQLRPGDEIRVVDEAAEWVAKLFVTYAQGSIVRVKITDYKRFGAEDAIEDDGIDNRFEAKQKGVLGWCIVDKTTNENIKQNIPSRVEAERELEDYIKALKA